MKIFLILFSFLIINTTYAEDVINDLNPFESTRQNRLGFMLGVYPSLKSSTDTTNFTFSYARKLENYWIDSNVLITNGLFRRLSANNAGATGASDFQLSEQKNSVTTFGLGIGRETQYAQTLIPLDDLYELTAANLTYNVYNEGLSNKTFTGPGLLAKFSLYKMFSEFYAAGVHFNYNLAVVKRAQDTNTETSSRRSLTLGYLTVGFDLSLFL
jgi:hypothetical protein